VNRQPSCDWPPKKLPRAPPGRTKAGIVGRGLGLDQGAARALTGRVLGRRRGDKLSYERNAEEHRVDPRRGFGWVVLALTVAFVALAVVVGTGLSAALDASIAQWARLPDGTTGNEVARAINQGGGVGIAFLAAAVGLVLAAVRRNRSWLLLLAPLVTVPIELLAKNVIPRTMVGNIATDIQLGPFLTIATPYTFPSGNMARVAALVFALLLHPARARIAGFRTTPGMVAVFGAAAVLAVTAWSHLAIGDHWPSDVVGGLLLGTDAAFALDSFLERRRT
jgi:membrane-associated phospholipid phosphatase